LYDFSEGIGETGILITGGGVGILFTGDAGGGVGDLYGGSTGFGSG